MRSTRAGVLFAFVCMVVSATAAAQTPQTTTARVKNDQTIIWRSGFFAPATVVKAGTLLEVVARRGDFYEVVIPTPGLGQAADERGFVAVSQVELVSGPVPPERATPNARGSTARPDLTSAANAVRVFGHVGFGWFQAHETYRAIFKQPGALWYGGGAEVRLAGRFFALAAVQNFRKTGERAFALDDEVSRLGIADTVTITPVTFTVGYRTARGPRAMYIGAGAGRYFYKESFEFADDSEKVDERLRSYHALVGFEQRHSRSVASAFEVQYTHVPNALTGPLATSFGESNLGGLDVRVKVLFGR